MLAMLVGGCSGSDSAGSAGSAGPVSCSAALPGSDGGAATPALCIDFVGGTVQDVADNRRQCVRQGNTSALTLCPHMGASGGCRQSESYVQMTTWYYDDTTAEDTKALCDEAARFAPSGVTIEFVLP